MSTEKNLKGVVSYVRNHLTEKTGKDYSELPFIFGTVSRKNKRYNSDVEEGMRRYAKEDKNAYLIDMSEAELMGDKLHFNQVSAEYMGMNKLKRLFRMILMYMSPNIKETEFVLSVIHLMMGWRNIQL